MQPLPNPHAFRRDASPLTGNVSGVYFLFDGEELVYVGEGWNCLLRVAEHTRKESDKRFTHWAFLAVESSTERKALERALRSHYSPRLNRV
jgi:excinuclease UvrABC nuclease subunit